MRNSLLPPAAVLACALTIAAPAHAAQEDTQLWVFLDTLVPVAHGAQATIELSPRLRQGSDQLLTRATLDFDLAKNVTLGGGAAYIEYAGGHEFRPHQQLNLGFGPLALRTRLEERFFAGADRAQIRMRERAQVTVAAGPATKLSGSFEWLYIARTEDPAQSARTDSWRVNLTARQRLSPKLEGSLGYLMIYSPRSGAPDRVSHIAQISLVLRN